jgi:hypothetical protein
VRAQAKAKDADAAALQWPLLVVAFLAGECDGDALLAKAAALGGPEAARRRCEALLHIGLVHARAGRKDDAVRALARAVALDTRDAWEWSLARANLRRLLDADR